MWGIYAGLLGVLLVAAGLGGLAEADANATAGEGGDATCKTLAILIIVGDNNCNGGAGGTADAETGTGP